MEKLQEVNKQRQNNKNSATKKRTNLKTRKQAINSKKASLIGPNRNNIGRNINEKLKMAKTNNVRLQILNQNAPKKGLFTLKSSRVKQGRNQYINRVYKQKSANFDKIFSNLHSQSYSVLSELSKIPSNENIDKFYNEKKLEVYKELFGKYGFTYIPSEKYYNYSGNSYGSQMNYLHGGGQYKIRPEHFKYETFINLANTKDYVIKYLNELIKEGQRGWQIKESGRSEGGRNGMVYTSGSVVYSLQREYPSTYPPQYKGKEIYRNQWDSVLQDLTAVQPA
jgi:hypothetical protein